MVDVWSFPNHVLEVEYPQSGQQIQLGRGYTYATKPDGPDQIIYTLNYKAMWFYLTNLGAYDKVKNPSINMALLVDFYNGKRLYTSFYYPHPVEGNLMVKFKEPLKYKILENGKGQVEPFSIKLILQP